MKAATRKPPQAGRSGAVRRLQSLAGLPCPFCRAGTLHLDNDGTNACDNPVCRQVLVSEWEWNRRQRETVDG